MTHKLKSKASEEKIKRFRAESSNGTLYVDTTYETIILDNEDGSENISFKKKLKYLAESVFYDSFETEDGVIYKTSYNGLFWVLLFAIFSNFCWIIYFLFFNSKINDEDEEL